MKVSCALVFALATLASAAGSSGGLSVTRKSASACKIRTSRPGSTGYASRSFISSVVSPSVRSVTRSAAVPSLSAVSTAKPPSTKGPSAISSGGALSPSVLASRSVSSLCPCPAATSIPAVTSCQAASDSGPAPTTESTCDPSAKPLPPKQDPWYSAPDGFENTRPGAVLKVRNACGLVSIIKNTSAAYQILYRTTDSRYLPSWAVTTLLVPNTMTNNLLSYQIPYDSPDLDASPSYSLYSGGGLFGDTDITQALGRGLYVITPDYEGPSASFTAGVISGHATLDSLRAVLSAGSPVQLSTAKYALWGYSGGALASEWATELQVQYAPELNIAGAALGGLTPNVTSVLLTINGTLYAGLAPSGILGLASQYPDAEAYLQSQLFQSGPYNATTFNSARNNTLGGNIATFVGQDISRYFQSGFAALEAPVAQRTINRDGIMGYHGVPQVPLFIYKAIGDDISVIADTDALVDRYCGIGATIDYQRNTVGNHASELPNGVARAVAFLTSVFAGTYDASGCQITNVTVSA